MGSQAGDGVRLGERVSGRGVGGQADGWMGGRRAAAPSHIPSSTLPPVSPQRFAWVGLLRAI